MRASTCVRPLFRTWIRCGATSASTAPRIAAAGYAVGRADVKATVRRAGSVELDARGDGVRRQRHRQRARNTARRGRAGDRPTDEAPDDSVRFARQLRSVDLRNLPTRLEGAARCHRRERRLPRVGHLTQRSSRAHTGRRSAPGVTPAITGDLAFGRRGRRRAIADGSTAGCPMNGDRLSLSGGRDGRRSRSAARRTSFRRSGARRRSIQEHDQRASSSATATAQACGDGL